MATIIKNEYTGDGVTTLYSFTFPYISESDVKVSLDGVEQESNTYEFANATQIAFDAAPANGVSIVIFRDTNVETISNTFYPGSAIRARDLNDNFTQSLYVIQEADISTSDANSASQEALETAQTADAKADTALTDSAAALQGASQAAQDATQAAQDASAAQTSADNAEQSAQSALGAAQDALQAVQDAGVFTSVADVASIPGSPADDTRVRVEDSSGIGSFSPLQGLPMGFSGDSGLYIKIIYQQDVSSWVFVEYGANDPDVRYAPISNPTFSGTVTASTFAGDLTGKAGQADKIVRQAATTSQNLNFRLLLGPANTNNTGAATTYVVNNASRAYYNPSSDTLGGIAHYTGNAASATNADKVDNIHASQFLRSDTTDTASGSITFSNINYHTRFGSASIYSDNSKLVFGTGGDGADFWTNGLHLYLDLKSGIGNFYIRDGSTTRFTFDDNGNFEASGNVRANEFKGKADSAVTADSATTATNATAATRAGLVTRNTWNTTSWRDLSAWTDTTASSNALSNAVSGYAQINGQGDLRVSGEITADILNGGLSNGQVRSALASSEAGGVGTYAFLGHNGSDNVDPGSTKSGSNLRYSNANAGQKTQPPGNWRLMGRLAGSATGYDAKQTSLWHRYV